MEHRCDILVFNTRHQPMLIVECKSVKINLSQKVFDQVARYNMKLKVPLLMVTNGIQHIFARIDFKENSYQYIEELNLNDGN